MTLTVLRLECLMHLGQSRAIPEGPALSTEEEEGSGFMCITASSLSRCRQPMSTYQIWPTHSEAGHRAQLFFVMGGEREMD